MKFKPLSAVIALCALATAFAAAVVYGNYRFALGVEGEIGDLLSGSRQSPADMVTEAELLKLPEPVRRYFHFALPQRRTYIRSVEITFTGIYRTSPSRPWLPMDGRAVFSCRPPGALWWTRFRLLPAVWIEARERYQDTAADRKVRFHSIIPMASVPGGDHDARSSLARFYTSAPWFPTVLLAGGHLQWTAVSDASARADFHDGGHRAAMICSFDAGGKMTQATTIEAPPAPAGQPRSASLTVHYRKYRNFNGVEVPVEMESVRRLDTGDFSDAKVFVTGVLFDMRTYRIF